MSVTVVGAITCRSFLPSYLSPLTKLVDREERGRVRGSELRTHALIMSVKLSNFLTSSIHPAPNCMYSKSVKLTYF